MTSSNPFPIELHADQEHGGIRAVILIVLIIAVWASFILLRFLLAGLFPSSEFIPLFSCLGSFPLSLLMIYYLEHWLKRRWHSGRRLTLEEGEIRVIEPKHEEQVLTWSDNLTHLNWFFRLSGYPRGGRERRLPKSWVCLACQLQQDERRVVVHSYLPVKKAAALIEADNNVDRFHQITPADVYDNSFRTRIGPPARPDIPTSVLAGRDGRYWLAERRRWSEGFELSAEDFATFLRYVRDRQQSSVVESQIP